MVPDVSVPYRHQVISNHHAEPTTTIVLTYLWPCSLKQSLIVVATICRFLCCRSYWSNNFIITHRVLAECWANCIAFIVSNGSIIEIEESMPTRHVQLNLIYKVLDLQFDFLNHAWLSLKSYRFSFTKYCDWRDKYSSISKLLHVVLPILRGDLYITWTRFSHWPMDSHHKGTIIRGFNIFCAWASTYSGITGDLYAMTQLWPHWIDISI